MRLHRLFAAAALGLLALTLPIAVQPASAAVTVERDYVVEPGEWVVGYCSSNEGAHACFGDDGDIWYVEDTAADGHSAAVEWENYVATGTRGTYVLYRHGWCIEKNGNGKDGNCNKNYIEGSKIQFRACTYESSTNSAYQCEPWTERYPA